MYTIIQPASSCRNLTNLLLAVMYTPRFGIEVAHGKKLVANFTRAQYPDFLADVVLRKPLFNFKVSRDGKLEGDTSWIWSEADLVSHAQASEYKIEVLRLRKIPLCSPTIKLSRN